MSKYVVLYVRHSSVKHCTSSLVNGITSKGFSTGGFNEGNAVLSFHSVKIILQGALHLCPYFSYLFQKRFNILHETPCRPHDHVCKLRSIYIFCCYLYIKTSDVKWKLLTIMRLLFSIFFLGCKAWRESFKTQNE